MKTTLLPKQAENIKALVQRPDLPNYSMPGTGKTLTTIGAIEAMGLDGGVVIAPPIALKMWQRELEHELGASTQIVKTGTAPISGADWLVMTYQIAVKKHGALMRQKRQALVLDESHYLKTPDSARTSAVFGRNTDGEGGIYERSRYCFTLTGTPIERHSDDLWAQLRATQPEALHAAGVLDYSNFVQRFTVSRLKQYHPRMEPKMVTTASKNENELNELLYSTIGALRNVMGDVANDMPEVTFREITVRATLDAETAAMLRGLTVEKIAAMLLGDDPQIAKARQLIGLAKIADVAQYVLDSAAAGPVLVGHWHREFGDALAGALRKAGVVAAQINGSVDIEEKDRIAAAFNDGRVRVIVGQIASMGVSLNLQALSHHVIIAEDDWSPSRIEQFYKRVWRLGQKNHVQVDFCVADTVVDDAIVAVRTQKATSAAKVHAPMVGNMEVDQ